jgi:GDP-L-fucose synthase
MRELRPEAVINCAAHVGGLQYFRQRAADVLVDNTRLVLACYQAVQDACPQATVINPISNCTYPGDGVILEESKWLNGPLHESVLPYGVPRRLVYDVAICYERQHGIRTVNWLVPNMYGPGDHTDPQKVHALNGLIMRLITAQCQGAQSFTIWGTGTPVREWCYVEDAARILVDSVAIGSQVNPINIAQKRGFAIREIAELAAGALGYDVEFVFDTNYPDGAAVKIMDDGRFREKCPSFQFTPLDYGIQNTVSYYRQVLSAD